EGYAVGINNGFMCPNDVRRLEGFDLIPEEKGGDTYMVQGAMIPLSMVGAAYYKQPGTSGGEEKQDG
ncbi:MAG: phage portal protein, partial [Clostridia bacterium]|nr:phage portal protein [Clostridia bacterium]